MTAPRQKAREFIIIGPKLIPDNSVFEAIHALYYLPENYKLIFTGRDPVDQSFYKKVAALVERDELGNRVLFFSDKRVGQAIIVGSQEQHMAKKSVSGDSAEALASAILNLARAKA